jgi:hypothetical protein
VNHHFFVALIGTRDGALILNSLNKGGTVKVIDLEGASPRLVTVTNGWGFIVVYAKDLDSGDDEDFLYVFSVNGELLRKKEIDFEIKAWTTWTSLDGFDFMAVVDENGKLFAFEVFYCEFGEMLFRFKSPVVGLSYARDLSSIVSVTGDGKIFFVPQTFEH